MYQSIIKRIGDILGSLLLLTFSMPFFVLLSFLVYVNMGRPVFFRQERPGKDEKIFSILKFRTMTDERDGDGKLLDDEKRLKGFGKLIRSLSLDELPQLFNILKGDMSFVGPRPLLREYLPLYSARQKKRHEVKPGITGWAQVNGRNAISWKQKFEYDVWYTKHISFRLDLKILIMTLQRVFMRKDISSNTHITSEKFNGKN